MKNCLLYSTNGAAGYAPFVRLLAELQNGAISSCLTAVMGALRGAEGPEYPCMATLMPSDMIDMAELSDYSYL